MIQELKVEDNKNRQNRKHAASLVAYQSECTILFAYLNKYIYTIQKIKSIHKSCAQFAEIICSLAPLDSDSSPPSDR